MIRKVYEVDPMTCPKCGGAMNVVAFLMEDAVADRIIGHLKLTFVAERRPHIVAPCDCGDLGSVPLAQHLDHRPNAHWRLNLVCFRPSWPKCA